MTVSAPNGGESWTAGTTHQITWTVAGSTLNVSYYKVALSTDGGNTWPTAGTPNDLTPNGINDPSARSFSWPIDTSLSTTLARIRLRALAADSTVLAENIEPGNFTIAAAVGGGTWMPLANLAPGNIQLMLLLSDGSVLGANPDGNAWYKLTPANGNYAAGTWTTTAPMQNTRQYCSSAVLPDGRLFVAGGEYGSGSTTAEIYDPTVNAWVSTPSSGQTFKDSNCILRSDGSVLVAPVSPTLANGTIIYNPVANNWTSGGASLKLQDEASWVKLPDGSVLTVDPSVVLPDGTIADYGTSSERYFPSHNWWIADATVPVYLYAFLTGFYGEIGPSLLLPNGEALFLGGQGHTALYAPSSTSSPGTWTPGPDIPASMAAADSPAAMMPNGKILFAAALPPVVVGGQVAFSSTTSFYEYDYSAGAVGSFTRVASPTGGITDNVRPFATLMLDLPDGTVLYARSTQQLYVYQPTGLPIVAGKPTISGITLNADGSYHLMGTDLNGISAGATYGDDAQVDSNYPIVRMTNNSSGNVYYARTYSWSSTGVATGNTPVSTEFAVPPAAPVGPYSLVVVANGISSDPVSFTVSAQYTITASAGAGGTLSPSGTVMKNAGDSLTFTASPNPSYAVNQWLLDGNVVQTGGTSYTLANIQTAHGVQVTFTYIKSDQTITFAPLPNKALGEPPFTLSASASSGMTVTFSVLSGPASISGNTATINNTGAVSIQAAQSGSADYNPAPTVDQSFTVYTKPTLSLMPFSLLQNVVITWPTNVPGFTLESATDLTPTIVWSTVTPLPTVVGGQNTVTNSLRSGNNFYRLAK